MQNKLRKKLQKESTTENTKATIVVTEEVFDKIRILCNMINDVEWSGILLYSVQMGSIRKPENLILQCEDIIPMNKGTQASTSFEYTEVMKDNKVNDKFVEYMMAHPGSENWREGAIHSHNNMKAYLSGTDIKDIEDNAKHHNYYLSMVVNNKGEIVASIGVQTVMKDEIIVDYQAQDEDGKYFTIEKKPFSYVRDRVIILNCEVIKPAVSDKYQGFYKEVNEIIEKAEKKKFSRKGGTITSLIDYPKFREREPIDRIVSKNPPPKFQERKIEDCLSRSNQIYKTILEEIIDLSFEELSDKSSDSVERYIVNNRRARAKFVSNLRPNIDAICSTFLFNSEGEDFDIDMEDDYSFAQFYAKFADYLVGLKNDYQHIYLIIKELQEMMNILLSNGR